MSSRASSSRGRGRGRGKPGIIPKNTSSSNQSGSSTQNIQIDQSKQSKADYAFPIQTLLAFQEQGLTNLPTKTWASIAEESDQDQDIPALDLAIQIQKTQITQANPKPNQIKLISQSPQIIPAQTNYIPKENFFFLAHLEPEFYDENPNKIPSKIFPPQFHFLPFSPNKTQVFYEFILVDTDSVSIKHYRDPHDNSNITHSTLQILKVLTPSNFGFNPNKTKKFSQPFDPIGYNYWDYVKAWDYVILGLQNKSFKHSWLIYFKKTTNYSFPNWFLQWWDFFGPIPEILPIEVQEGFQIFSKRFNKSFNDYPILLNFFTSFSLSWVFSWQYKIGKYHLPKNLLSFYKQAFTKWWSRFDASMASPDGVTSWFKNNPKFLQVADPDTCRFLNQRARIAAALAASNSEEDVLEKLQNVIQLIKDQSSSKEQSSSSSKKGKEKQSPPSSSSDEDFIVNDDEEYYADYSSLH